MKKRDALSSRLAEEVINEIMMAGVAFFLVIIGINYFSMRWAWTKVLSGAASAAGFTETQAGIEVAKMLTELSSTFPFKYLFVQYDFWGALFIAVLLSALGIWLKLSTVRRGGKFFIDLGKNIYSPAVIGFILIIVIHIWLAFNVNEYVEDSGMPDPGIGAGFFVWEAYGQLFLFAAAALIIGAVIKLIGEKNDQHVKMMVGETVFNGALLLLLYYLLIRVFALDVIMQ
ncbi:hypothetical protein KY362_07145, partial [Candidatus Woesearchaeota archaeon]|nr:hypothetical protein [Candidatus Woesearchaeota archaeon]